jgi:hypothetical protein
VGRTGTPLDEFELASQRPPDRGGRRPYRRLYLLGAPMTSYGAGVAAIMPSAGPSTMVRATARS